ncbi:MAG: dTDP-4-amino-4,6-dideoxygalactose transaminase [Balneolaceae bacterium]|nr:dTDP-4-amino-4,6-dideoxygalactose transaminase [Balneolaceae bacterium]MBO6546943.1 dTDP-4-amino-4,6-dideoxygalactose transaminase [Balneolaceae bacterium]MBO6649303.1 dTDP-4-amino-4,6-dideoxygalactose transaminase [Balneolaceae bacterium]
MTFNRPYITGNEIQYLNKVLGSTKIAGNGKYTKKCQSYFVNKYGFKKALLTTSCTDALEMCAILANISSGDEVIMPSYTFVSTANAFLLRGAKIKFVDSREDHPGMNEDTIEANITDKTKAIVVVHYAGVAVDMDKVMSLANKYDLLVIEDAAQAIDSYYKDTPLGSIGHLSSFSFHETKNIISGEGGLLAINDGEFTQRSEIIWEKGTNRSAFFRGEVDKYGWVDIGSSFLPSELIASFLYAQLEQLVVIQSQRKKIWTQYFEFLKTLKNKVQLPNIPEYATNNAHMFYFVCSSIEERTALLSHLKEKNIYAVFHYQSLHKSEFFRNNNHKKLMPLSDRYSDCLVRLPFYIGLTDDEINYVAESVLEFYK